MSDYVTGEHALAVAHALGPGVQIYYRDPANGAETTIDETQAERLIRQGEARQIFVPIVSARLEALIERCDELKTALENVPFVAAHQEEQARESKLDFIGRAATAFVAAKICQPTVHKQGNLTDYADLIDHALELAHHLHRRIYEEPKDA